MSELWPQDVAAKLAHAPAEAIRPFRCLLLMPFEDRFNAVAELIRSAVSEVLERFRDFEFMDLPNIRRLDWVSSAGVIQQEIWREIRAADLVFCDLTGYNANVMFEAGVCAAWKRLEQVVFIRDHFYRGQSPIDMAPLRYCEYALTGGGVTEFRQKVEQLVKDAVIAFPDDQGTAPAAALPVEVDFETGHDDSRIYTPPFAHRRVVDAALEFGSLSHFAHSWASVGNKRLANFTLTFIAQIRNPRHQPAWIGVGLRSQHYFANFAHILYLNTDGTITLTQPDEQPPHFYTDQVLRQPTPLAVRADHRFHISFDQNALKIAVDDFSATIEVARMPKVLGPGLIRFQAFRCWMGLRAMRLE